MTGGNSRQASLLRNENAIYERETETKTLKTVVRTTALGKKPVEDCMPPTAMGVMMMIMVMMMLAVQFVLIMVVMMMVVVPAMGTN